MLDLPPGYTSRPATPDDIEAIVDVINEATRDVSNRDGIQPAQAQAYLTMPGFDLATSSMLIEDPDGSVVAAEVVMNPSPHVSANAFGSVRPRHRARGLGSALVEWACRIARDDIPKAPGGTRVVLRAGVESEDSAGTELLSGAGMALVRHFFEMEIDLTGELQDPAIPEGLVIRPLQQGEERALYTALLEAFEDHWGHVNRPFEEGFARFRHRMEMPGTDTSVWWVAMDGDEIAGMNLCQPSNEGDDEFAWCDNLGVRRPWRRRGLALAMLLDSYREFSRRGHTRMGLGVDASSLTGATVLYEKAGMRVTRRSALYELVLREGTSLMKESAE